MNLPYAIDFDSTLAETVWPESGIGAPIEKNIFKLREVVAAGYDVVIHTSRPWGDQQLIEDWCDAHDIPYKAVICGKFLGVKYVDDKGINSEAPSWL